MPELEGTSQMSKRTRRFVWAHALGLGVFLLLQVLGSSITGCKEVLFSAPAAKIAAFFLGSEIVKVGSDVHLYHGNLEVAVTEACSGFDFFCLILALWVGWQMFHWRDLRRSVIPLVLLLPCVWSVTLLGNVSRIVTAAQARVYTARILPDSFDAVIHQAVGVVVFLSILMVFWKILTKLYERAERV